VLGYDVVVFNGDGRERGGGERNSNRILRRIDKEDVSSQGWFSSPTIFSAYSWFFRIVRIDSRMIYIL
jgi:hypothetical protein